MEIKHKYSGAVVYKDNSNTLKEAVENAILSKIDLRGAYLRGADLRGADLRGAYLRGAVLSEADLREADLRGAVLSEAVLRGAYLSEADLSEAVLMVSHGLHYAQMSFTGFGEINRLITLADINIDGNPIFFCGCFKGTNEELISYIENGNVALKESRHFARKTLLDAIKFSDNKNN